ncbi:MAG TPA: VWA domain-containing protein [Pyrinomonadaceae bacterium]|nr:VWA domain-containing protein [Pyrinomonadaceae bacterium]
MKHSEVEGRGRGARTRGALAIALAALVVAAAALPAARAERQAEGRPRRAEPARTGATTAPRQTPAPQQPAAAQPQQTPTPAPARGGPVIPPADGAPVLKTAPPIRMDEGNQDQDEMEIDPEGVVTIDTSLVNLQVRVVDRNNRPISGIRQEEFRVFENGQPQTVQFVTTEEVPVSYGLVVDNSGSLRSQIQKVIDAGKTIVESNQPGDETFVVRFVSSEEIKVLQDFTSDKQAVFDALDDMYIEGGQTAVMDAVYLSAEHATQYKKGDPLDDKRRRALILVTDGEDRASFYKQDQLFEALKENDVQIYVIGFVNELEKERGFISKSRRQKAVDLLDRLAKETGGRAFYPTSLSELPDIAREITKDLRTQYVVSYRPNVPARPGEFRQVRVAVADAPGRDKRIAVTRSGYTGKTGQAPAPPPQQQPTRPRANVRP